MKLLTIASFLLITLCATAQQQTAWKAVREAGPVAEQATFFEAKRTGHTINYISWHGGNFQIYRMPHKTGPIQYEGRVLNNEMTTATNVFMLTISNDSAQLEMPMLRQFNTETTSDDFAKVRFLIVNGEVYVRTYKPIAPYAVKLIND